ncbi:MAG: hypothetical protein FWE45_02685 [Firmicutes bacterium]|nr:hypothetical protein [Bacillota bacterium]
MKRQRGELRSNALKAKKRLGQGFWDQESKKRDEVVRLSTDAGVAMNLFTNKLKEQVQKRDEEFEAFYLVVKPLLVRGVANLHAEIIDHEHMAYLTQIERERYVIELSRKVQRCVERYNRETEIERPLQVSNL